MLGAISAARKLPVLFSRLVGRSTHQETGKSYPGGPFTSIRQRRLFVVATTEYNWITE
jgi:hypothetical protein